MLGEDWTNFATSKNAWTLFFDTRNNFPIFLNYCSPSLDPTSKMSSNQGEELCTSEEKGDPTVSAAPLPSDSQVQSPDDLSAPGIMRRTLDVVRETSTIFEKRVYIQAFHFFIYRSSVCLSIYGTFISWKTGLSTSQVCLILIPLFLSPIINYHHHMPTASEPQFRSITTRAWRSGLACHWGRRIRKMTKIRETSPQLKTLDKNFRLHK